MKCLTNVKVVILTIKLCLVDLLFFIAYVAIGVYFTYNSFIVDKSLKYIGMFWILSSFIFAYNVLKNVLRVLSDDEYSLIKFDVIKKNGKFYNESDLIFHDSLNEFKD